MIKLRYFAWLRQRTGCAAEEIELPEGVATVAQLAEHVGRLHPRFAEAAAARGVVRCAVNQEHATAEHPVKAGDEVAFFPPVTGG